ncbi:contact-dependent growth inhibition system immunity protein [Flavobacterium sp.]|uniref:contact-dependent growth inhibition system immunity protein n=1 Tax=Flavobacterium sp. TaxID=239 RepID=UPI0039E634D6
MKFEKNWPHKTLESLEKKIWPADQGESHLITTCLALRKKQLKDFTTEDLRIMIRQEIGLEYLIPMAIEVLSLDLFAEGDLYPGDLLSSVFSIDTVFWDTHKDYWEQLDEITKHHRKMIAKQGIKTEKFDASQHNPQSHD